MATPDPAGHVSVQRHRQYTTTAATTDLRHRYGNAGIDIGYEDPCFPVPRTLSREAIRTNQCSRKTVGQCSLSRTLTRLKQSVQP